MAGPVRRVLIYTAQMKYARSKPHRNEGDKREQQDFCHYIMITASPIDVWCQDVDDQGNNEYHGSPR